MVAHNVSLSGTHRSRRLSGLGLDVLSSPHGRQSFGGVKTCYFAKVFDNYFGVHGCLQVVVYTAIERLDWSPDSSARNDARNLLLLDLERVITAEEHDLLRTLLREHMLEQDRVSKY